MTSVLSTVVPALIGRETPIHLKVFAWLMYGSLVIGFLGELRTLSWQNSPFDLLVITVLAVLTWAAVRKHQTWSALVVLLLVLGATTATIGELWAGAPSWMLPEKPTSAFDKALHAATNLMALAAVAFYFVGEIRAGAYAAAPKPKTPDGQTVPLRETCANCGTRLIGLYCHNCSQSSAPEVLDFREGFGSLVFAFFKIDHKLLRTVKIAVLSPGKLSLDFRNGIHIPHTPPVKLILLVSVTVALVLALTDIRLAQPYLTFGPDARVTRDATGAPALQDAALVILPITQRTPPKPPPEFMASLERELAQEKDWDNAIELRYWKAVATGDPKLTRLGLALPLLFLGIAPLSAALLALFFHGKHYPYGHHLVFAVHLHSVALMLLLVAVPVIGFWPASAPALRIQHVLALYTLLFIGYLVAACRTFYGTTWLASVSKSIALGLVDGFLIYYGVIIGLYMVNLLSS